MPPKYLSGNLKTHKLFRRKAYSFLSFSLSLSNLAYFLFLFVECFELCKALCK